MGGRGGSSGFDTEAISAKMPELSGSAKQVSWAEQIRTTMLKSADAVVHNAQAQKRLGMKPDKYSPSLEGAKFARKDVINTLKTVTTASTIIDARNRLTQSYIKGIALDYDRSKK